VFLGHFALAFGATRADPRASLGALVAAAQWPDLLWPVLLLLGRERVAIAPGDTAFTPLRFESYPISHSLLAVLVWACLGGAIYRLARKDARGAAVIALLVISHWILDAVTHRPDLPITPAGGTLVGLGLWNSVPLTMAVELLMFTAGVLLYFRAVRPRRRIAAWSLVAFLTVIYFLNIFGEPPPSPAAVAWVTLSMWLLVAWAWAADRRSTTAG
jgi:hypothetical protein